MGAEPSHTSCAATNVLRSAPQKALDFFAFDVLKVWLLRRVRCPSHVPSLGGLHCDRLINIGPHCSSHLLTANSPLHLECRL